MISRIVGGAETIKRELVLYKFKILKNEKTSTSTGIAIASFHRPSFATGKRAKKTTEWMPQSYDLYTQSNPVLNTLLEDGTSSDSGNLQYLECRTIWCCLNTFLFNDATYFWSVIIRLRTSILQKGYYFQRNLSNSAPL